MSDFSVIEGTTEIPQGENVYRIPDINWVKFNDAITAVNKRAKRLGCNPATVTLLGDGVAIFPMYDAMGNRTDKVQSHYRDVKVTGEIPSLNGWSFVATIQHAGEAGNVLRTIPGMELPEKYRDATPEWCDHCGMVRNRKDTYVVTDGTEYKQVGSTCLRDFTGTNASPTAIANRAEWLFELISRCAGYGQIGDAGTNLVEYLSWCNTAIRVNGWVSKTQAYNNYGIATAQLADTAMSNPNKDTKDETVERVKESRNDDDVATATTIVEWVRDYLAGKESLNDYEHNVKVVTINDYIGPKMFGIAASVIPMYNRAMEQEINRRIKATMPPSNFVGTVGAKVDIMVTVTGITPIQSNYGVTMLTRMMDSSGNVLTWFNTGSVELEQGKEYRIKGTVKAHNTYRDENQTVLTRCKVA